jgi:xylulose-5-phosphate/fructose-6-phosphate phosphoketolase
VAKSPTYCDKVTRLNDLDRFHLVTDVIERVPKLKAIGAHVLQEMLDRLVGHKQYIVEHGDDMPEIRDWKWPYMN